MLLIRPPLARRALAEFCGTAFLVAVVVGSGIAAQRLSPHDTGLQLFENAAATAGGLVALILAFGPVSGAHLNPVVTLADAVFGGLDVRAVAAYVAAQIAGGMSGAVVANLMFDLDAVSWSTHSRSSGGLWLGEVVATLGLLMVIFGVVRSGRASAAPFAVGAYIGAAYFFTSSTSFANPAVTIARAFTDTFAGIEPSSVPAFVVCQVVGGAIAVALIRTLYRTSNEPPTMSSSRTRIRAGERHDVGARPTDRRRAPSLKEPACPMFSRSSSSAPTTQDAPSLPACYPTITARGASASAPPAPRPATRSTPPSRRY